MRITGGVLCGRKIAVPEGVIRPAMDSMRESVFATLGDITGCSFLDLFSGSGIIAIEAASRGAALIEAVEKDPLKRKTLLQNVAVSPVRINCRFMAAELYVQRGQKKFDIIFCDPPFSYAFKQELVKAIAGSHLVKTGSQLLIHHPREDHFQKEIEKFHIKDTKKYGRSFVDFFRLI